MCELCLLFYMLILICRYFRLISGVFTDFIFCFSFSCLIHYIIIRSLSGLFFIFIIRVSIIKQLPLHKSKPYISVSLIRILYMQCKQMEKPRHMRFGSYVCIVKASDSPVLNRHKQYAKQRCKYKSKHYKEYYAYDL